MVALISIILSAIIGLSLGWAFNKLNENVEDTVGACP